MDFEPDHFLEEYWKNFKSFINKLSDELKIVSNYIKLDVMVNHLNKLKSEGKYIEIEKSIEKYLLTVGWLMIKNYNNYFFHIYMSRLKEWKKVPIMQIEATKKKNSSKYLKFTNDLSFDIYIGLINTLTNHSHDLENPIYKNIFSEVHIPNCNDVDDIAKCCQFNIEQIKKIIPILVDDNKAGSLTILSNYINLHDIIKELYNVHIMPKTNGKKIIDKINEENKKNTATFQ
jgi:hypothetical protein